MKKTMTILSPLLLIAWMSLQSAQAGPLAPIVDEANHLRATARALNHEASALEHEVNYLKAQGVNPVFLQSKARRLRAKATRLAWASNHVAKSAFDHGYIRPNYSVIY